jgi:hypothetical protein
VERADALAAADVQAGAATGSIRLVVLILIALY